MNFYMNNYIFLCLNKISHEKTVGKIYSMFCVLGTYFSEPDINENFSLKVKCGQEMRNQWRKRQSRCTINNFINNKFEIYQFVIQMCKKNSEFIFFLNSKQKIVFSYCFKSINRTSIAFHDCRNPMPQTTTGLQKMFSLTDKTSFEDSATHH